MTQRIVKIIKTQNGNHVSLDLCGIEDFSIEEMREIQHVIGHYCYEKAMSLSYLINDLQNNNLKEQRNNNYV